MNLIKEYNSNFCDLFLSQFETPQA